VDIGHDELGSTSPPPPNTPPSISDVTNQTVESGWFTPAIGFTVGDAETAAGSLVVTASSSNTALLPQGGIVLGGSGGNRTATLTPAAGKTGSTTITLTVTDGGGLTATDTFVLTVTSPPASPPPPPASPPPAAGGQPFAIGSVAGSVATVTVYNADGTVRFTARPFGGSYAGGVNVAVGDVTGDGVPDVVVGTDGGTAAQVRVIDGATRGVLPAQLLGKTSYTGSVSVAVGDVTGDGLADIAAGTNESRPWARVFRGGDFVKLTDFAAGPKAGFTGRTQVALGDMTGDGLADLVATGFYSAPKVFGYDGASLRPGTAPSKMFSTFTLSGSLWSSGVFLALGDVGGDGQADIILGRGSSGSPRVTAFAGRALLETGKWAKLAEFVPEAASATTGVRVAVRDIDGDGTADIVTSSGSKATVFRGGDLPEVGTRLPVFLRVDTQPGMHVG
jgi:hypothetical protein